jgi:hypothetical protein
VVADVFYTKLSDVYPDDEPARFVMCKSFDVLV